MWGTEKKEYLITFCGFLGFRGFKGIRNRNETRALCHNRASDSDAESSNHHDQSVYRR